MNVHVFSVEGADDDGWKPFDLYAEEKAVNLQLVCRLSVIASFVFRVVWQADDNVNDSCIAPHYDVKVAINDHHHPALICFLQRYTVLLKCSATRPSPQTSRAHLQLV